MLFFVYVEKYWLTVVYFLNINVNLNGSFIGIIICFMRENSCENKFHAHFLAIKLFVCLCKHILFCFSVFHEYILHFFFIFFVLNHILIKHIEVNYHIIPIINTNEQTKDSSFLFIFHDHLIQILIMFISNKYII